MIALDPLNKDEGAATSLHRRIDQAFAQALDNGWREHCSDSTGKHVEHRSIGLFQLNLHLKIARFLHRSNRKNITITGRCRVVEEAADIEDHGISVERGAILELHIITQRQI